MELNPVVLRNKGVPIELARVRRAADGRWELDWDPDASDEPPTEKAWVRFTNNEISEIEERFNGVSFVENEPVLEMVDALDEDGKPTRKARPTGEIRQVMRTYNGLEGFQRASEHKPASTNREALAIALHREPEAVGAAMLPEKAIEYNLAIATAFSIATGTPAERAGKVLEAGRIAARRAAEQVEAEAEDALAKMMETADGSPGLSGSPPGSESPKPEVSDEASTSSGA